MVSQQTEVEDAVEAGVRNALHSALGTLFWTVLSVFAILIGYSAILVGFGVSTLGARLVFFGIGLFVIGCSVYLLYDLYRPSRT